MLLLSLHSLLYVCAALWWLLRYYCDVGMCTAIHKTVSVVLLLGNMQFKQEKNSDQAVMPDDTGNWCLHCYSTLK